MPLCYFLRTLPLIYKRMLLSFTSNHYYVAVRPMYKILCFVILVFLSQIIRAESAAALGEQIAQAQKQIDAGKLEAGYFQLYKIIEDIKNMHTQDKSYFTLQSEASVCIGDIYVQMAQYDSAIWYYQTGLQLAEQIHSAAQIRHSHTMLGDVFARQEQFDRALYHLQIAKNLPLGKGEVLIQSGIMSNIGTVYFKKKEYNSALKYYYDGLAIAYRNHHTQGVAWCEDDLGLTYFKLKKYDSALVHYERALQASTITQQTFFRANVQSNIGNVYLQTGDMRRAIAALEAGKAQIVVHHAPDLYYELCSRLSKAYKGLSNFPKAYEMSIAASYADSIVRENMTRQRTHLLALQPEIARRQAALLKLELSQKTLRLRISIGIIILVLVSSIVGYLMIKKQREARWLRIERDIAKVEADQEARAHRLKAIENERLLHLVNDLQDGVNILNESLIDKHRLTAKLYELTEEIVRSNRDYSTPPNVGQALVSVKEDTRKPIDEPRIAHVLAHIDTKLIAYINSHNMPPLGKREVRLATYILMGYNTREIAELSGIAQRSVEQARYRLRQKLELPEDANLREILQRWIHIEQE